MRAISAHVKFPNTPESDKQLRVLHVVELDDETTKEVWATDPIDAIDIINANIEAGIYETRPRP